MRKRFGALIFAFNKYGVTFQGHNLLGSIMLSYRSKNRWNLSFLFHLLSLNFKVGLVGLALVLTTVNANADWKGVSTVTSPIAGNGGSLRLGALPDGSAIAVWTEVVPLSSTGQGFSSIYWSLRTNGAWSTSEVLVAGRNNPLAVSARFQDLVVGSDGSVTVAWAENICSQDIPPGLGCYIYSVINASTRSASGVWSPTTRLSEEPEISGGLPKQLSGGPLLGISSDNSVTAVWVDSSSSPKLLSTVRSPGGSWSSPQSISNVAATAPGFRFDLDVAPDGSAAVSYLKSAASIYGTFVNRRVGGSWQGDALVSPIDTEWGNNSYPDVAIGNGGKIIVVWQQYNLTARAFSLRTATLPAGQSSWLSPTILSSTVDLSQTVPRVVINSSGVATAAWTQLPYRAVQAALQGSTESAFGSSIAFLGAPNNSFWGNDYSLNTGADGSTAFAWSFTSNGFSASSSTSVNQAAILPPGSSTWGNTETISGVGRGGAIVKVNSSGAATALWGIPRGDSNLSGVESNSTVFAPVGGTPTPSSTPTPTAIPTPTPKVFSTNLKPSIISLTPTQAKLTIVAIVEAIQGTGISYALSVTGPKNYKKTLSSKSTKFTLTKLSKGQYKFKVTVLSKIKNKTSRSKTSSQVSAKV